MTFFSFENEDSGAEDLHYMKMALIEAEKALTQDEIPIGAVIVCKNRIVGRGYNLTEKLGDVTAHAEMQAFTSAAQTLGGKYLTDCTLYVTLEPCVMCAGASFWTKITRIVYGAQEEKFGYSTKGSNLLHPKTQVTSGVLGSECAALMQNFFKNKR
ncbi:MAG: nucleoside deaminase [Pedobacter sp.]|nr:nucleoside deaminase [Pedobacter sp.]